MKIMLVVMAAVAAVAGLALLCGYLSGCTKRNDDAPRNGQGNKNKRTVSITLFRRDGEAACTHSHLEGRLAKKEVLERVSEWWDSHGTGLNDYDKLHLSFPRVEWKTRFSI